MPSRDFRPLRFAWRDLALIAGLLIVTAAVYSQVRSFGFTNYDTPDYVTENAVVRHGWTAAGLRWALTSMVQGNWHPLTWLSHMTDVALFGDDPGWQHLTSVAIHLMTTALLFLTLLRMTAARWPAAIVAFIFALHPLHVESVVWIAERKDVLCAFFWMLTLWMYVRYTERRTRWRYAAVIAAFAGGLMAKAMIVTLPVVLLLLDWWPLRRPLALREKLPLGVLSAALAVVTIVAQLRAGAVATLDTVPIGARAAGALVSYVQYLYAFVWPSRLAAFYPLPAVRPIWQVLAAAILLAAVTAGVWRTRRTRPYLLVGWTWFVTTLVPVIGVVQIGAQARADRYTYVPLVGIAIAVGWSIAEIIRARPALRVAVAGVLAAAAMACTAATWRQLQYWRTTETLFRHAIDVTSGNYVAWNNLGVRWAGQGRFEQALDAFDQALRNRPGFADALANRGNALHHLDRDTEALEDLQQAVGLRPDLIAAHINLGTTLNALGHHEQALAEFARSVQRWPDNVKARLGLGVALKSSGRIEDALAQTAFASRLAPANADARFNLGELLAFAGRYDEAAIQFQKAVELRPGAADAHFNLGNTLATMGRMDDAIAEYREAVRLEPASEKTHANLGSALAESGRLDEAIDQFSTALRIAPDSVEIRRNLERARALRHKGDDGQ